MKYTIFNKETNEYESPRDCVLTQLGEVAFWDESQGWNEDYNQGKYVIAIIWP